jgi:hypothetical protein
VKPYDAALPDRDVPLVDPTAISMPPHTSIDITAYLPEADSEPTA